MAKIEKMVAEAKSLKAQMNQLAEESPEVASYLALEEARTEYHKKIKKWVMRYGVNPDNYPGLVAYQQEGISVKKLKKLLEELEAPEDVKQAIRSLIYSFWKAYTR